MCFLRSAVCALRRSGDYTSPRCRPRCARPPAPPIERSRSFPPSGIGPLGATKFLFGGESGPSDPKSTERKVKNVFLLRTKCGVLEMPYGWPKPRACSRTWMRRNRSQSTCPSPKTLSLVDPFAVTAIRLLVFTGAQLREILHAKWSQIDFQRGNHSFARQQGRPKADLFVGRSSFHFERRASTGQQSVSYSRPAAGGHRADLKSPWAAVARAAGTLKASESHDLRHSFASVGAGASLGLPIIGRLLGHSQPSTTARYAHLDADPMRRAADTIGAVITAAMGEQKSTAVVSIQRLDEA